MTPWKPKGKPWTEDEVRVLRELYPTATRREMLEKLPNRTLIAIKGKAHSLKVRRRVQIET
jgi:hypothetical protein